MRSSTVVIKGISPTLRHGTWESELGVSSAAAGGAAAAPACGHCQLAVVDLVSVCRGRGVKSTKVIKRYAPA